MNKKGQIGNMVLVMSLMVILTIIIFGVINTFLVDSSLTASSTVVAEQIDIVSLQGNTLNEDVLSVAFFGNATVNTSDATIGIDTNVNWTSAGLITVAGQNFTDNPNYLIGYNYQPENYISDSSTRTLVSLIPLILALVIFAGVAVFAVK